MDAIIVKNKVSLLEQVCPTNLPGQPGVYTRKQSGVFPFFQVDPLFPEGTACQSAESIFFSSALLTNSYFYPSCDQDYL